MILNKANVDWQNNVKLSIEENNGPKIPLTIKSGEWSNHNNYTLILFSNNPLHIGFTVIRMPFIRRLLSSAFDTIDFNHLTTLI
jgi:hypothetical protein